MMTRAAFERMTFADYEFADRDRWRGWGTTFFSHDRMPAALTSFGWFSVLAVAVIALGAALGFAS